MKGGTHTRYALRRNSASMMLGYWAADRQAHARSCILVPAMQALKHSEDAINVLRCKTDAVILNSDLTELLRLGFTTPSHTLLAADKLSVDTQDWSPAR